MAFAAAKVEENLKKGRRVRDDEFFSTSGARTAGDEVAEGVLLVSQRDPEEKKVRFYGNLLGNLAFHPEIDRGTANLLVRLAGRLSYQQLVLLTAVYNQNQLPLAARSAAEVARTPRQIALYQELLELYSMGLLGSQSAGLDLGGLIPSQLKTQGLALQLYMLMELDAVDHADWIAVASDIGAQNSRQITGNSHHVIRHESLRKWAEYF